jgi:hypothetical protein
LLELTVMKLRPNAKSAIAAVGLAAAGLATGAIAAQASPHVASHSAGGFPGSNCQKWAKDNTFVWITKAAGNPRHGLTVTGQTVRVHCGGPDDLQYIATGKHFTGHLVPDAKINVLTFGTSGIEFPKLAESKFSHWVATDRNSGIYAVTGPVKAIRALQEEYHP